jgi:hypothetical protein
MELPTHILIGGIAAVISASMIVRLMTRLQGLRSRKVGQRAEDGHDRAAKREERWYALDEPMRIDRTTFETTHWRKSSSA